MRSGTLKASLQLTLELLEGVRGDVFPQNFSLKPFDDLPLDGVAANHDGVRTHTPILMEWAAVLGPPNAAASRYQNDIRPAQSALQKTGEKIPRGVRS